MLRQIKNVLMRGDKKSKVIRYLIKYGLSVNENGEILCGSIKIPYSSLARAAEVDRRTVRKAVEEILNVPHLKSFFSRIEPAGPSLRKVARLLGYRCLIIEPIRDQPGILALVSSALAKRNINIIQVIAEDPNIYPQQKLYVITEGEVPGEVIDELLKSPLIVRVILE